MANSKVALLVLFAVSLATLSWLAVRPQERLIPDHIRLEFVKWQQNHGKLYATPAESDFRLQVFADTIAEVDSLNKRYDLHVADKKLLPLSGPMFAVNQFADISDSEFSSMHRGLSSRPDEELSAEHEESSEEMLGESSLGSTSQTALGANPSRIDIGNLYVRNQLTCGCCWGLSAIAAVERKYFLATQQDVRLSIQELIDCDQKDTGCNGGWADWAMEYIQQNGLTKESDYPYKAVKGTCNPPEGSRVNELKTMVNGRKLPFSMSILRRELSGGRFVATTLIGDQMMRLMAPNDDIYDASFSGSCWHNANHGVAIIEAGSDWLRILNSYGRGWGDRGTKRIRPCSASLILGTPAMIVAA